ncbi:MAG: hypothetical protein CMG63_02265 [Candidatus Marinimicrobia bacterium]|nr:hypothetical protein [Candidatus Neomarinimicrobiota bacterium]
MPFYIKKLNNNIHFLALIHFLLGLFISGRKDFATIWGYGILFYGLIHIVRYRNKYDDASIFASYMVGIEVVLRTVGASVLWEYGKYSTILLLLVGMFLENIKFLRVNILSFTYFVCLLPSIALMPDVKFNWIRQMISGNLSGPLCLFISFIYFRQRKFSEENLINLFRALLLPVCSLLGLIFIRAPAFQNITFTSEANFQMSAGFGPNQVSTVLGVSLIIIGLARIFNLKVFKNSMLDYLFLSVSIGVALLTFARGGVIAPVVAMVSSLFISGGIKKYNIEYKGIISLFILMIGLSYLSSNLTKGLINSRYASLLNVLNPQQTTLAGRTKIMAIDLEIFLDNFLMGVGPGCARALRWEYGFDVEVGAHSEFTRMLAEHGLFGFISLFSILMLSFQEYRKRTDQNRVLLACMSIFGILTMFHSAFRIALPGFIYGLSYVILNFRKQ